MRRVGQLIGELKGPEMAGIALGLSILGLGSICLEGVDRGLPQLSGRAVAESRVTPRMNERGIPEEPCSWTPYNHQQVKRLVGGGWAVNVDGRCRDHADGAIRAYSAPYENEYNKYVMEGGLLVIEDGQEVEVICAKTGEEVIDRNGFESDRWLYVQFPYDGIKIDAFLPAVDAGYAPSYIPSYQSTGNVIPECPKF